MTSSSFRVAFLTYCDRAQLTHDDQIAATALAQAEIEVKAIPWDSPDATQRLQDFDAAIFRSPWNYTEHCAKFLAWVDEAHSAGVRLFNDAATVRWNADKIYLRELEANGHSVLPTQWIDRGSSVTLRSAIEKLDVDRVIVKPRISATARGLFATSLSQSHADQAKLDALLETHDVMLQPFADEITQTGEWSLLYFAGKYSHGVIKRPKVGEHRVQGDFGGTHELLQPSPALLEAAQSLVDERARETEQPLLYARVDGIERAGKLVLMELELIEPELFFRADPEAAERFIQALKSSV